MTKVSRRELARWAADQLQAGKSASEVARHLAAVLAESNRTAQIDFLLGDIAWELEQRKTLAIGHVTTASEISKELEATLSDQIKKATGADSVVIEKHIDKKVIGGVRVETASHVWDHTVSRKLTELREVF